jgi:hypothetical protein
MFLLVQYASGVFEEMELLQAYIVQMYSVAEPEQGHKLLMDYCERLIQKLV